MNRPNFWEIIACVLLLLAPAAVFGDPAGPEQGLRVNIVNPLPVPVTGEVTASIPDGVTINNGDTDPVPVTGEVTATIEGEVSVILNNDDPIDVNVVRMDDSQNWKSITMSDYEADNGSFGNGLIHYSLAYNGEPGLKITYIHCEVEKRGTTNSMYVHIYDGISDFFNLTNPPNPIGVAAPFTKAYPVNSGINISYKFFFSSTVDWNIKDNHYIWLQLIDNEDPLDEDYVSFICTLQGHEINYP